jgi:hypothetical protein
MNRIEEIVEQFACTFNPAEAARTARKAIDTNFIVMDPKKLPQVTVGFGGMMVCGETTVMDTQMTASHALRRAREWTAIAKKLGHMDKEKANRERELTKKRDEVYRRLYPTALPGQTYNNSFTCVKTAIDYIIDVEEKLDAAKKYR